MFGCANVCVLLRTECLPRRDTLENQGRQADKVFVYLHDETCPAPTVLRPSVPVTSGLWGRTWESNTNRPCCVPVLQMGQQAGLLIYQEGSCPGRKPRRWTASAQATTYYLIPALKFMKQISKGLPIGHWLPPGRPKIMQGETCISHSQPLFFLSDMYLHCCGLAFGRMSNVTPRELRRRQELLLTDTQVGLQGRDASQVPYLQGTSKVQNRGEVL